MARITLYGFLQYDSTLLDGVKLPDGMDNDIMKNLIIERSGDLYPYYQVPDRLKANIASWFTRRQFDFEMIYKALTASYNPIENYDRTEVLQRDYANSGSDKTTSSGNSKAGGSDTTQSASVLDQVTTNEVAAFDSSTLQVENEQTIEGNPSESATTTYGGTNEQSAEATTAYGMKRAEVENNRIHGNIGVTTNQQMIQAELDLRAANDLYNEIASLFEDYFMIQVY